MSDAIIEGLFGALPLLVLAGLVAQWQSLRRFEDGWRVAAWVPVTGMGVAVAVAALGVMAGSNLAPIWIVFALPLCLLWLGALWLLRAVAALARG